MAAVGEKRPLGLCGGLPEPSAAKRGGNNRKKWVRDQFDDQGACKQCPQSSKKHALNNTTVLKKHLLNHKVCGFLASETARRLAANVAEIRAARVAAGISDAGSAGASSNASQRQPLQRQSPIVRAFGGNILTAGDNAALQRQVAEMRYRTNLPHSWIEHPAVLDLFKTLKPAFIPPSRFQVSGRLLREVYGDVTARVSDHLARTKYITLTTDGWSRTQGGVHVLNFMACAYCFSCFLDAMTAEADTGEATRVTAAFVADTTMSVINKHKLNSGGGPSIVALVTDTPAVMKAAWAKMQEPDYLPGLICFGCLCHVLDLFLKDVGKLAPIGSVLDKAMAIAKHFTRNTIPASLLKLQQQQLSIARGLELSVVTRFATNHRMLSSLHVNKRALMQAVATAAFEQHSGRGSAVASTINDEIFWADVEGLISLLEPVVNSIMALQRDTATLADGYWALVDIDGHVAGLVVDEVMAMTSFVDSLNEVQQLWQDRRTYGWHAALPAAALLDPRHRQRLEQSPMSQQNRIEGERLIRTLAGDGRAGVTALVQLQHLRHRPHVLKIGDTSLLPGVCAAASPLAWWADNGAECPELTNVAEKLLSITPTAAGGERNWSTWSSVWSDTRSSLLVGRVCMLVYVHYNIRVLERQALPQPAPELDWMLFLRDLGEQPAEEDEEVGGSGSSSSSASGSGGEDEDDDQQ